MTSSDKTLRDILNQIIKHSELKYWILNRNGFSWGTPYSKLLTSKISA